MSGDLIDFCECGRTLIFADEDGGGYWFCPVCDLDQDDEDAP